ncbi:MAG: aspartate/glutamate racemase family protein [Candidatus Aminicenantaceae bacterium]
MKKTIGILGGMGPEATSYFYELIIKNTKASKDQEHIQVVIYSNPKIPPRTDAIFEKGPSPLSLLIEGVKILRQAGANFIVMPCVTAHYYYREVVKHEKIPFLNLLDETLSYVQKNFPRMRTAGLIASSGTIKSKLFHDTFARENIKIIAPYEEEQEEIMDAIFGKEGIKAGFTSGRPKNMIQKAAQKLIRRGAEAVIAGCTEVPLVLKEEDIHLPLIEPLKIMAQESILKAGYEIKEG